MDVLDVAIKEINEKVAQLQDAVASGTLPSYDEYKRICGEIQGLLAARNYLLDLKQNLESFDD